MVRYIYVNNHVDKMSTLTSVFRSMRQEMALSKKLTHPAFKQKVIHSSYWAGKFANWQWMPWSQGRYSEGTKQKTKKKERKRGLLFTAVPICVVTWFLLPAPFEDQSRINVILYCLHCTFKALETWEISRNVALGHRGTRVWMEWVNSTRANYEKLFGIW